MKMIASIVGAVLVASGVPGMAQTDVPQAPPPIAQEQTKHQAVPDIVLVDQEPSLKKSVEPVYPPEALAKNLEGKVWLKVLIDSTGHPAEVELLKSDNEIFNDAAMTAARQFTFNPALKDKRPVAVWVSFPFKFKLGDKNSGERTQSGATNKAEPTNVFMDNVQLVLAGDAAAHTVLDPEAYLVDGKRFVSLNEALFGKEKGKCFAGERSRKQEFLKVSLSDDRNAATMVLETVNATGKEPHWHTITWTRKPGANWKITHWHMSR